MATLYTPEAKTQGLDWLAGMVQNSQQLWQRERSLAQEAQRLQVAKQQQALQAQQFWATQARLQEQQDFQDRKFLYDVKDTERRFEWGQIKDNRAAKLDERRVANAEQAERRLGESFDWSKDPQNPDNQYRVAATDQTRAETAVIGKNPMDWLAPTPRDGTVDQGPQAELLPKVGFTGDPMNPYNGQTPDGRSYSIVPGSVTKSGINYQTVMEPATRPVDQKKQAQDEIDDMRTRLASLSSAKESLPAYPSGPKGEDPPPAAVESYRKRVAAVENTNRALEREVAGVTRDLRVKSARMRMMEDIPEFKVTPAFSNVAPQFFDAITRKDPVALENLRVQIKPLADDKDPAAVRALKYIDDVFGEATSDNKELRTGGAYYAPPR